MGGTFVDTSLSLSYNHVYDLNQDFVTLMKFRYSFSNKISRDCLIRNNTMTTAIIVEVITAAVSEAYYEVMEKFRQ